MMQNFLLKIFQLHSSDKLNLIVKPKILYIVNVDWFFISHRLPIAMEMKELGYEVHVALKVTDRLKELQSYGFIVHDINFSRKGINLIKEVFLFFSIYSLFKTVNPSLCHLVTAKPLVYGGLVSKILDTPCVAAFSGLGHIFSSAKLGIKFIRPVVSFLYKFIFSRKKVTFIFQNRNDLEIIKALNVFSTNEVHLLKGSGVDINNFNYFPELAIVPRVVIISRLLKQKGIIEFLEAAAILLSKEISAEFIIYGDIDKENPDSLLESDIKSWSSIEGINFAGFTSEADKVLKNSHVLVLPSYYGEGFPRTLIEGSACGRAIVTTDHPGCRDAIIPNETGILVPIKNSFKLSEAIEDLINDPERRSLYGMAGRRLAEKEYDINNIVFKHIQIYKSLMQDV